MVSKQVKLVAVGDISTGDHYFSFGHGVRGNFEKNGIDFIFSKVKRILLQGDICFCNLEGVLVDVLDHLVTGDLLIEEDLHRVVRVILGVLIELVGPVTQWHVLD